MTGEDPDADAFPDVLPMMHAAPPASVFTVMRAALREHQLTSRLWLADYRQSVLRSVEQWAATDAAPQGAGESVAQSITDGVVGRVFTSQRPAVSFVEGATEAYFPVDDRGTRLGVLQVAGPRTLSAAELDRLREIALALGQQVAAAERFTDHFETYRRTRPFTLAAEMQWALLPATSHAEPRFEISGLLEPAYSVAGDTFDWSINGDTLTIAVCDGTARGVPAAIATTLCAASLRNARRAGLSIADQAALADQALYSHYSGATYVAAVLIEVDLRRSRALVVDAGSPQLFRVRDGQTTKLTPDAQLPLGMFEETRYDAQAIDLLPRDRLVVVSDGVHEATGASEAFGERGLTAAISRTAAATVNEAARTLIAEVHRHHPGDLDDDAVVVCLDWTANTPAG